jgi:hypothetical protein
MGKHGFKTEGQALIKKTLSQTFGHVGGFVAHVFRIFPVHFPCDHIRIDELHALGFKEHAVKRGFTGTVSTGEKPELLGVVHSRTLKSPF